MTLVLALSSDKTDKYESLTAEKILSFNQIQVIQQAKFTYSSPGEMFDGQIKTVEDQGEKTSKYWVPRPF